MSDLIERLRNTAERVLRTRARFPFGVGGQTVEASARGEMHEISAWDAEIMHEAAARIAELEAEVARLREALGRIAVANPDRLNAATARQATNATGAIARAALAAPDTGGADDDH